MGFEKFVDGAAKAMGANTPGPGQLTAAHPLLNGVPYKAFREAVEIDVRRQAGAFFSGEDIATELATRLREVVPAGALVMDPTCGIGDLLLAYAAGLPVGRSLTETLGDWGRQLAGMDLQDDLDRMAKIRLIILAQVRGKFDELVADPDSHFPLIRQGDVLKDCAAIAKADGFLFNPPFGQVVMAGQDITWSSGQINAAAIFLTGLLANRKPAASISALLPEVLRCGSRYAHFREHLRKEGLGGSYRSFGRFDSWTDVDVFSTLLRTSEGADLWQHGSKAAESTVGGRFTVRVGAVVPHRDPVSGDEHDYVCAKTTPAWSKAFRPTATRRFEGTVFRPPFVVVRRTSSPSDRHRAVGSVVIGSSTVAVENHLLILRPESGAVSDCEALLKLLEHKRTSDHLNQTIRCRHLTTGSVKSIPWTTGDD